MYIFRIKNVISPLVEMTFCVTFASAMKCHFEARKMTFLICFAPLK